LFLFFFLCRPLGFDMSHGAGSREGDTCTFVAMQRCHPVLAAKQSGFTVTTHQIEREKSFLGPAKDISPLLFSPSPYILKHQLTSATLESFQ
jgi:hypothetical protein